MRRERESEAKERRCPNKGAPEVVESTPGDPVFRITPTKKNAVAMCVRVCKLGRAPLV